ncbi:MAG: DUF917 domain-containing protein [Sulfobacillus thermosulfidooxidans]|uniref:DUF917 domain-containing protein n=1 Tax=Sulfobacillus thermosulfidooxidans TaxID=28034 RepID=A0A2T2WTC2_SULTH|nr:MAG: DUF917 domain-containing protein [Sulfobacillus thermosulfidooxidans]
MKWLTGSDLDALALGATFLGTGGGGDPYIGRLMAEAAIRRFGDVQLVDIDELPEDGLVVPAAMMGAPTVMVEKIPSGKEVKTAVNRLETILGRKAVAIMTIEAGGINSMIPLAVAAEMALPIIDGDSMGRAFPELQMTSLHIHEVSATPMVIVDEKGNNLVIDAIDNPWTERLARSTTIAMGGSAIIALYPVTVNQAKQALVRNTISKATRIGHLLQDSTLDIDQKLRILAASYEAHEFFQGKVVDVLRRSADGFARGTMTATGMHQYEGDILRIEFQNENLLAMQNGVVVTTVPDLICVLDSETLRPITTEMLTYGQRIRVLGMPAESVWHTSKGLETVGPRYFGYDFDYIPFRRSL